MTTKPDEHSSEPVSPESAGSRRGAIRLLLIIGVPVVAVGLTVLFGSILMPEWPTSIWLFKFQYRFVDDHQGHLLAYQTQLNAVNGGHIPSEIDNFLTRRLALSEDASERRGILTFYALQSYEELDVGLVVLGTPLEQLDVILTEPGQTDSELIEARLLLVEQIRCCRPLPTARLVGPSDMTRPDVIRAAARAYRTWWQRSKTAKWAEIRNLDPLAETGISWKKDTPSP